MPRVLIVDDNPASFESLADVLEVHDLTAVGARSAEEALERIAEEPPDCLLLDTVLPGMDGFELCEILKRRPETASLPVIFLTGKRSDEAAVVRALDLGATDFLVKPVRIPELIARIQAAIRSKALHDAALVEPAAEATPIQGRTEFLKRLQEELDRSANLHRPLCCVLVSLELPPESAERFGERQTRTIEEQLAPQIQACCRRGDICGHLGDRCCGFILSSPAATGGQALSARIRDQVAQSQVVVEGEEVAVRVVAGIAEASLDEPPTAEELLRRAEEALARARSAGPGSIVPWSPAG